MSVLFYDPCCPRPYTLDTLRNEPLGGTEATVIRIAEALNATVVQHNRSDTQGRYWSAQDLDKVLKPTAVVCLRNPELLPMLRAKFPVAKLYLWMHDLAGTELIKDSKLIKESRAEIIVVSDFHKTQVREILSKAGENSDIRIHRIYNPIDNALLPDSTPVDNNKLVFFSSPHKGLEDTLAYFSYARRLDPELQLYIANPGYLPTTEVEQPGVHILGTLPHHEAMQHVRSALCVFYPNMVFPETFGLVFAEANAVGTPVLTHRIGAASEVLYHPAEFMDCRDYRKCVDRVLAWKSGVRPKVRGNPEFRLSTVVRAWNRLLTA